MDLISSHFLSLDGAGNKFKLVSVGGVENKFTLMSVDGISHCSSEKAL